MCYVVASFHGARLPISPFRIGLWAADNFESNDERGGVTSSIVIRSIIAWRANHKYSGPAIHYRLMDIDLSCRVSRRVANDPRRHGLDVVPAAPRHLYPAPAERPKFRYGAVGRGRRAFHAKVTTARAWENDPINHPRLPITLSRHRAPRVSAGPWRRLPVSYALARSRCLYAFRIDFGIWFQGPLCEQEGEETVVLAGWLHASLALAVGAGRRRRRVLHSRNYNCVWLCARAGLDV